MNQPVRDVKRTQTSERPGNRPSVLTSFSAQPLLQCFENVGITSSTWLFCIAIPVGSMKNFTARELKNACSRPPKYVTYFGGV